VSRVGVPRIEAVKFPGPAGVLEGILRHPEAAPSRAALLCHPHPLHGGSMHSPVIFHAARALHRRGYATLRFNFRGVGLSTGRFDAGRGEKEDVLRALDLLVERVLEVPVTLLGYSFGSRVGFEAAGGDPRVARLVGIGLPVTLTPFDFLKKVEKPILLVQGSRDEYGPLPAIRRLAGEIGARATLVTVPGADHLFTGELGRLEESLFVELPA
jgi:hypothetical protein